MVEASLSRLLALLVDGVAFVRGVEQEALVGAAAHQQAPVRSEDLGLVDHVVAAALDVAIDDGCSES